VRFVFVDTATAPCTPGTVVAVSSARLASMTFPSCPLSFPPQQATVASSWIAQPYQNPALTLENPAPICAGVIIMG